MESSRILVTGLPDDISKTDLTIYFQSTRDSGGGDVRDIRIEGNNAFITFEDVEAAARIVGKGKHYLKKRKLLVSLLSEAAESSDPEDEDVKLPEMDSSSVENGHAATNTSPDNNFSRSHGAEASMTSISSGKTPKSESALESPPQQCTVKVTGILTDTSEDLLKNYFENERRSKGGPVSHIDVDRERQECLITFDSPDDAARTVENSPHKVAKLCLEVSLLEVGEDNIPDERENRSDDESHITIIVNGTLPSKDALWNYFENERRSGGGEILDLVYNGEGDVLITFAEVKDLKRLLEDPHVIDKNNIKVTKQPPKKKVPLDPMKIHVQGLSETTSEDCLRFYLEKFIKVEVAEVFKGYNNNALAVFDAEPDFEVLLDKVSKDPKGLEGKHIRLERVPVCSSIYVRGLKKETSDDTIELYFENRRKSGGSIVSRVERKEKDEALVYFEDSSSVQEVIQRNHALDQQNLEVKPYYPFLENTEASRKEIPFDSEVFEYIQINHQQDLQAEYDKQRVQAEVSDGSILIIFPTEKKGQSPQLWQKRTESLESFLKSFKKSEVPIEAELFDEIKRRWEEQSKLSSPSDPSDCVLSFNAHERCAQIIGKESDVDEEELKLKESIDAANKDTELMKSVVEVEDRDILMGRLRLLKLSGICEKLQNQHQHLAISIDLASNRLILKGPRTVLQEVKVEIYPFVSKMMEKALELPMNVINVLKKPRVFQFTQSLLKQKSILALFVSDLAKRSNEIQVVGVGEKSLTDAEAVLQNAIQERSLPLTHENKVVLESREWEDLLSELNSSFMVEILADWSSSTLWVSGIVEDVQECFGRVQHFLEMNTILSESLSMDQGTARFILEKWKNKLDEIKEELAPFFVDMRAASDCKSIEVTGTAKGLQHCLSKLKGLISAVQKGSLPVDKPGIKKFILKGNGPKSLRAIEESNHCVIITKASNEDEEDPFVEVHPEIRDLETSFSKFMCSYLTKEGKKISVFQDDITKHQADAIVNAANSQLKHIGGVAAAILKAGGQEIETECNNFIRDKGTLLEGHVLVTTAGRLPCDKVIHTVGPQWIDSESPEKKQKKERLLNYAITNCLKKAQSSRTVAIPAVSSGVYGFPRDLCAKVILDAVLGFCTQNPGCNLSEIHLINNDGPIVKAFVDEMRKRFADKSTFIDKEEAEVTTLNLDARGREHKLRPKKTTVQSTKNIRITVKIGDLAEEKADILVGTAAPDLDLTKNPCARALSEAAGKTLQEQCSKKGPVAEGDIAVIGKTGRLNCQAIVFAVCPPWNDGNGKEELKRILLKCLQEAENRNMSSIAFSSIGTGMLKFPPDQVADIYFHEIISFDKKHPTTSIKDVRFVLYSKDTPTIQAFEAAKLTSQIRGSSVIKRRTDSHNLTTGRNGASFVSSSAFSPVNERKPNHFETTVGSLCFQVQPGDITKETTDAIAVISNGQLDLSSSGTGAAILRSGGDSIKNECKKRAPQNPGSVVITAAGRLKARYLYHIIPADDLTTTGLKACLVECLKEAERKNISSISFPAIGTGVLGISAKTCADAMLAAILELVKEKPKSLKLVKMTIFQESMVKEIRLAMDEASGVKSSQESGWRQIIGKRFKTMASAFGFGGNDDSTTESRSIQETENINLDLVLYAGCENDLQEAIKAINELMKENYKQQVIEHEAINSLSEEHMHRIHTLELRYSVEVNVEKQVDRIVLDGQAEDILQVVGEIHGILHEVKKSEHERSHAEVLSKDVQWKYRENDRFEEYESGVNAQIELAYQRKSSSVMIMRNEEEYRIDFDALTENDGEDNTTEVRRIDLRKDLEYPNYWVPQPTDANGQEETVHLFELDPSKDTLEYQKVSDLFSNSCSQTIVKIERVQNPTLYGTYAINKQKMDKERARGSNEMWLFHGTKGPKCELINHKGFNRSFCGENAAYHGNGVYFALKASYSAQSTYSPADSQGNRHMYLARVIVGEYTLGKQGILTPPPKSTNNLTDTYDSVVDKVLHPSIYVVFYDWQCYPEYLITFQ